MAGAHSRVWDTGARGGVSAAVGPWWGRDTAADAGVRWAQRAEVWRAAFGCSDPAQGLPEATSLLGLAAELAAAIQACVLYFAKTLFVTCSSRCDPLLPPMHRHASLRLQQIYMLFVWLKVCLALAFSHMLWRSEPCSELGLKGEKL